jgi:hypothetical protein
VNVDSQASTQGAPHWLLFTVFVVNVLGATLFYPFNRVLYAFWWSNLRRLGATIPSAFESEWMQRGWSVLAALLCLALW